jgi:hypothetical protein
MHRALSGIQLLPKEIEKEIGKQNLNNFGHFDFCVIEMHFSLLRFD